jgi:hypothetical protein
MNIVVFLQLADLMVLNCLNTELRSCPMLANPMDLESRCYLRGLFARPTALVDDQLSLADLAFWERLVIRTTKQRQQPRPIQRSRCVNHNPNTLVETCQQDLVCDMGFSVILCRTCISGDSRAACVWSLKALTQITGLTANTLKNRLSFLRYDATVFVTGCRRYPCDRRKPILPLCFLSPVALSKAMVVSNTAQRYLVHVHGQWKRHSVITDPCALAVIDMLVKHPYTSMFISCPKRRVYYVGRMWMKPSILDAARQIDYHASNGQHLVTIIEMMNVLRPLIIDSGVDDVETKESGCLALVQSFFRDGGNGCHIAQNQLGLDLSVWITGLSPEVCEQSRRKTFTARSTVVLTIPPSIATRKKKFRSQTTLDKLG